MLTNMNMDTVKDVEEKLSAKNVTMKMGYTNGTYECIIIPRFHTTTNVVLGRDVTYIGALNTALNKTEDLVEQR